MESEKEKTAGSEVDTQVGEMLQRIEREKEEKLVDLIIEIIVSLTLKQYYETSNTIPEIQPDRTE